MKCMLQQVKAFDASTGTELAADEIYVIKVL